MTLIDAKADEPGGMSDEPVITLDGAPPRGRRSRRLAAAAAVAIVVGTAVAGTLAGQSGPDPTVTDESAESGAEADPTTAPAAPPVVVIGATPDPAHVARVAEVFGRVSAAHTPGWRWELRAEDVACWFPDGGVMRTSASEFPMEQALTADHLVQECSQGNDTARMAGGFDTAAAQVCVGGGGHPVAAVTLDGRSCDAADPGLRPMTDADLAELNRMRAVEVALLAAPQDCSSEEQSVAWAEQVVAAADLGLDVEVTPQMPDGSPAPSGTTPPDGVVTDAPLPPGEVSEPGRTVPTTVIGAGEAPPACFIARVDWTRPVIEIQGGMN